MGILLRRVVGPFARISGGLEVVATIVDSGESTSGDHASVRPMHPLCAKYFSSAYCKESWRLHMAQLVRKPETHWHLCDFGIRCAVVPLAFDGLCLAACKLSCERTMSHERFHASVELLELLIKQVQLLDADFLAREAAERRQTNRSEPMTDENSNDIATQRPCRVHATQAKTYIELHLGDPKLTVRRVADFLDLHPDYLAHLFVCEFGERMARYITKRRVERARTLLRSTEWQVKRVARECGFAAPNWFVHVFREHSGETPGSYRRHIS